MAHLILYALQKDTKEDIGSHSIHGLLFKINSRCIATRHHQYWWSGQLQYIAVHCPILKLIQTDYMSNFFLHHYCPPHFTWTPQNKIMNKRGNRPPIVESVSESSQHIYLFLNSSHRLAISKGFSGVFRTPDIIKETMAHRKPLLLESISYCVTAVIAGIRCVRRMLRPVYVSLSPTRREIYRNKVAFCPPDFIREPSTTAVMETCSPNHWKVVGMPTSCL